MKTICPKCGKGYLENKLDPRILQCSKCGAFIRKNKLQFDEDYHLIRQGED